MRKAGDSFILDQHYRGGLVQKLPVKQQQQKLIQGKWGRMEEGEVEAGLAA